MGGGIGGIDVTVRVRRDRLDLFARLMAPYLYELPEDDGENVWVTARLSLGLVGEARQLLQFSDRVEVLSPPEVRDEVARAAASVTNLYQRVSGRSSQNPSSEGLL
ncbi:DeoR family transcriptional regulator [Streptomyces sviceus ATCC 29083]|uniref:DeoR family transcriptional regulator n=1 Tax=Streptomyces sviceus (strain ATCC 29083 / DSM 924 / JCM 4929 / NBRC 13980 / NCIMB 11184 / NRRL 5439 / UC 5370) TaxID=463191 RepID=B5HMD1_STRX2|nr:DeoR family transcriptional regulator [Streptomyces sviceus ATCC 29083]